MIYEIKTEYVYENFSEDTEISHFSNYPTKSKHYKDSNKWVVAKDEMGGVATEKYFALTPKIYWLLVDNSSELKKPKGMNTKMLFK